MQDKLFISTNPPSVVDMEIPWSEYFFPTKSKGEHYFNQAEANSSVRRTFIHLASHQGCSYKAAKAFLIKNGFLFWTCSLSTPKWRNLSYPEPVGRVAFSVLTLEQPLVLKWSWRGTMVRLWSFFVYDPWVPAASALLALAQSRDPALGSPAPCQPFSSCLFLLVSSLWGSMTTLSFPWHLWQGWKQQLCFSWTWVQGRSGGPSWLLPCPAPPSLSPASPTCWLLAPAGTAVPCTQWSLTLSELSLPRALPWQEAMLKKKTGKKRKKRKKKRELELSSEKGTALVPAGSLHPLMRPGQGSQHPHGSEGQSLLANRFENHCHTASLWAHWAQTESCGGEFDISQTKLSLSGTL